MVKSVEQSNLRRSRYVTGRQTQVNSTLGARPTQEHSATVSRKTNAQDGARQALSNPSANMRLTGSQNAVRQTDPAIGMRLTGSQNAVRQTDPAIGMRLTGSQNAVRKINPTMSMRQSQIPSNDYYDEEDEYDDVYPTRTPSSARRYQSELHLEVGRVTADVKSGHGDYVSSYALDRQKVPARRTATQASIPSVSTSTRRRTSDANDGLNRRGSEPITQVEHRGPHLHWLVYVGIVMLVMSIGWIGLTTFNSWWQTTQDDMHYGITRTVHVDAYVGHNESPGNPSHFISMNLKGHIEIIEFQGGDPSKSRIYTGPVIVGQDQAVPLLEFKDVNGDHKPDMILSIQQSRFVFINENGGFRALRPGEKVQMGY